LDWLRDNAEDIGEAKRQAVLTQHMVRHVRALIMKSHGDMPVSAQEREAMASAQYRDACLAEAEAAGAFETMRALREAAALKIEAWRSEQANYRSMKI
jgi:rhamnose utilization protein RhaD (predicted bifunctional aldolase and dehydrogenase)